MQILKSRWPLAILILGILGIPTIYSCISTESKQPKKLTIYTGSPGGTYLIIGDALKGVLSRQPEKHRLQITTLETGGAIENLIEIENSNGNGIGFCLEPQLRDMKKTKVLAAASWRKTIPEIGEVKTVDCNGNSTWKILSTWQDHRNSFTPEKYSG